VKNKESDNVRAVKETDALFIQMQATNCKGFAFRNLAISKLFVGQSYGRHVGASRAGVAEVVVA
jgi:hypothetical protein